MAPELPPLLPPVGVFDQAEFPDAMESEIPDTPPSPVVIPHAPPAVARSVRRGCWLVNFKPTGAPLVSYDGTIRVEVNAGGRTASGDLYQRRIVVLPGGVPTLGPGPNPASGIPIQPLNRYRYYLSITRILEHSTPGNSFELGFQRWRYILPTPANRNGSWVNEGPFSVTMTWMEAPPAYPSRGDYLEGNLRNSLGVVVGRLTMGWVSWYYRKASIEIDTVQGSERPTGNGAGETWRTVGNKMGWDLTVILSQTNVTNPSGPGWSNGELHAGMLRWRNSSNLDIEWRYHLLAVHLLDFTERGVMYDAGGTDSNKVAREGAGVASHWMIPPTGWGRVNGKRWGGEAAPYFRAAVHELGHAWGLDHNTRNQLFMDTSNLIAAAGEVTPPKFPDNIKWNFADIDLRRLRHWSDVFVRPGGVPYLGASETSPIISPPDMEVEMPGLRLEVEPLRAELPLGAPVRINIRLTNVSSDMPLRVPKDLSLKSRFVCGYVTDVSSTPRTFSPIVITDDNSMRDLAKGHSITASLTLLRGAEGALFPTSGVSEITVKVSWPVGEAEAAVIGKTTVMVTGAYTSEHAAAAHKILATPDVHAVLVFGGDHLEEGIEAVRAALNDDTLRPHFAAIEAKRCARRFMSREPDIETARRLLDDYVVRTDVEAAQLRKAFKDAGADEDRMPRSIRSNGS
ncbi:hypothetical protein H2201_005323 [Coniosporium apollinis]|uniref:Peptidase M11 gametolysin domain-containing protein n=1 Tax=Coniosporium apollinis TaxID=61459 RepID=A0ABQ9NTG7_9PEZI|nr:hypothetical protein H2201_005323 [Coniosporium apollinis]